MTPDIQQKIKDFFTAYPARTFEKGQVLVHADEAPQGVFFVAEGRVNEYDISVSGTNVVVNVFKAGAFFPMSWAINRTPNKYFFEAAAKKVMTHIAPPEDAVAFLKDSPDVMFDLLARVFRGTDGLLRRMAHLMGGDAKTRLLFELLNAAYRFGTPVASGPDSIFVPLKEVDLAKHSGLARETVNRTIQTLKATGMIEIKHNGFVLHDLSQLEAALGNDI